MLQPGFLLGQVTAHHGARMSNIWWLEWRCAHATLFSAEANMTESDHIVFALGQDDSGRWSPVEPSAIHDWTPADGLLWLHLDRSAAGTKEYLDRSGTLDPIVRDALVAEETRPRTTVVGDGLLVNLRGVNLNPGANPEDMISLRIHAQRSRLITTRSRPILAVNDVRESLERGGRAPDIATLLVMVAGRLADRMSSVLEMLVEQEDDLEDRMLAEEVSDLRARLTGVRRQAISLRRYLAPQREALARLGTEESMVLEPVHQARVLEIQDRTIRYVEDLDAIRERAAIMQDELTSRLSDRLNRNMYLLTIISSIMLPLGFLTGLLGINVDGMPGATDTPWAFAAVCAGLGVLVALEVILLRRLRWF